MDPDQTVRAHSLDPEDTLRSLIEALADPSLPPWRRNLLESSRNTIRQLIAENQQMRDELAREARLREEFFSTISHELRTPMTATLGWASLMRIGGTEAERRQAAIAIENSMRAQQRIIDEIVDATRMLSGKIEIQSLPVALDRVVDQAVESLRNVASAKAVNLTKDIRPIRGNVVGDSNRLSQAVTNLLSNALKFTPPHGSIAVTVEETDDSSARITVADSGTGIAQEALPHVFDRFRQAERSNRTHGGLGLGLSVVKYLAEAHGGSVQVRSDGIGSGATFTVTLPIRKTRSETSSQVNVTPPRSDRSSDRP